MAATADPVPATTPHPPPTPRRMGFPFADEDIPKHWFGGNPVATHIANGLNLLFPLGERFFVRSVRRYLDHIDDPLLRRHVRGFFGQEGRHAHEHERFFEILRAQGYDIDTFLRTYERIAYHVIERRLLTPPLRLATTAACEHFTAIMADNAFEDELLETAHPVMRELLLWHAAEEIEHKSVAFDVFEHVDGRYPVRVAGFFVAVATLGIFWTAGARHMLRQEPRSERRGTGGRRRGLLRFFARHGPRLMGRALDFLRPGFHPEQHENQHLAREHFERIGRTHA